MNLFTREMSIACNAASGKAQHQKLHLHVARKKVNSLAIDAIQLEIRGLLNIVSLADDQKSTKYRSLRLCIRIASDQSTDGQAVKTQ